LFVFLLYNGEVGAAWMRGRVRVGAVGGREAVRSCGGREEVVEVHVATTTERRAGPLSAIGLLCSGCLVPFLYVAF